MATITKCDANTNADPLKGETTALVEHCKKIAAENRDTTVDGDWNYQPFGIADVYCIFFMIIALIKAIPIYLLTMVCASVPVAINWYKYRYHSFGEHAIRNTKAWNIYVSIMWVLTLPLQSVVCLNLIVDFTLMYIFGGIYCTLSGGWGRYLRNKKVIDPYRKGPFLYRHFADVINVCGSMSVRLGYFEFMKNFCLMYILNHWWKYWIICNPFMTELGERFVTQIGESLEEFEVDDINKHFQKCISWSVLSSNDRQAVDASFFCPHYPYPPLKERYAIGMQSSALITTFVHTTHFQTEGEPIFTLSNSVERPAYRVMLWYNNPWHIMTGYVEANISNQKNALEHPMWLIAGHNYIASAKNQIWTFNPGYIDEYFDRYLPVIQRFIKRSILGIEHEATEV